MGAATSKCCGEQAVDSGDCEPVESHSVPHGMAREAQITAAAEGPSNVTEKPTESQEAAAAQVEPAPAAESKEEAKGEVKEEVKADAKSEAKPKEVDKVKAKAKPKAKAAETPSPSTATSSSKVELMPLLVKALPKGFEQLLPNKLVWAPTCEQLPADLPKNVVLFQLSDFQADPYLLGGAYNIMHYAPQSYGKAFGPLSLWQLARFCQVLDAKMAEADDRCVVFGTPQANESRRTNAAVLIGGYLVLHCGWSSAAVARALGAEAKKSLPCPWYTDKGEPNLTVGDCWDGLEMGKNQGWITKDAMNDTYCMDNKATSEGYDASWLVPGHVLVSADPMSTVMDPNPATVGSLGRTPKGWVGLKSGPVDGQKDFLTWCKDGGVGLIVRANFGSEPGLREIGGSYDKAAFTNIGISQLDVPVNDTHGGVPDAKSVSTMLDRCKECTAEKRCAVLIHCKAGFGRSIFYASCWIVQKFDVPGRPLLAWMRMARPGSITTPHQERFLCGIKGRQDVETFIAKSKGGMFGKLFK